MTPEQRLSAPSGRPARLAPLLFFASAPLALAHPGHGGTGGFAGGFAHPLGGWDHVLALIAVGLWAAQLGGRARWLIPSAFIGTMALGAALSRLAGPIPGTEQAIAASVLILGLLVAGAVRLPAAAGATLAGVFALFHGLAHGADMPGSVGGLAYGAGFASASALLCALGVAVGILALTASSRLPRIAGLTILAFGLALIAR